MASWLNCWANGNDLTIDKQSEVAILPLSLPQEAIEP